MKRASLLSPPTSPFSSLLQFPTCLTSRTFLFNYFPNSSPFSHSISVKFTSLFLHVPFLLSLIFLYFSWVFLVIQRLHFSFNATSSRCASWCSPNRNLVTLSHFVNDTRIQRVSSALILVRDRCCSHDKSSYVIKCWFALRTVDPLWTIN